MFTCMVPIRERMGGLYSILTIAFTLLALGASTAQAATYYVATTGSDSNSGSQSAPFRQIRAAIAVVQPGDTISVADGTYLGFDINSINGMATAPITISAQGSNANIVPTTDRPDNRDTIFVTNCSYIVLDGLTSFNANRAAIRIDHSPFVTIRNGVYGNNTEWGIFTDFSDNLLIENNECYGSKVQHGIYVSNSCVNPTVNHNLIHDNYGCGLHMNGDLSQGGPGLISGALVEQNVIYNNGAGGGAAINLDGVQNSLIVNNLLYNNHASGIAAFQIDGAAGPKGDEFYYNTVDMASDARWALEIVNTAGQNTVRNNILSHQNSAHGGLEYGASSDLSNVDSDYNIQDRVTTDGGSTIYTLAQWQAKGHESHSLSAAPSSLWVNPSTGDYHLLSTAPAIGAGEGLAAVATDRDSTARPTSGASDIGCYEHISSQVLALSSFSVSPTAVVGGSSAQGTITLSSAAPSGGVMVFFSNNNAAAVIPTMVTVAAGATSATFSISTNPVSSNTMATLSAMYNGVTKTATLSIQTQVTTPPVTLSALSVSPNSVVGGNSAQGTITLSNAAPAGGCTVSLSSGNSAASVPGSITIAAGASSATFGVTTTSVTSNTTVTLTAGLNGTTQTASLSVQPSAVSSSFVLGVNLGGGAVTIESNHWRSYEEAQEHGLCVHNAQVGRTGSVRYDPIPDAHTRKMLKTGIWTPGRSPGAGFTLKQKLPNGSYQVYLWEVEDDADYARSMNVQLQGQIVATGIGSQPKGHWQKFGPYSASVTNGMLKIKVERSTKGDPQLMGMAIFKQ